MKRQCKNYRRMKLMLGTAVATGLTVGAVRHGFAQVVDVQRAPASADSALGEITVTASRRATGINEVPYNISAYGGEALQALDTTNLAQLAQQVPGFTLEDRGMRYAAATVPIIRGLNASNPDRLGLVTEQMPVGTYLGNSPVTGYFPLDDIQRVEVLRGPQGTLYGAGSLGGAIRTIPNDPELSRWALHITAEGNNTAHSGGTGYTASALVNIPIGSIAAFRISGKDDYEPGFIDQLSILERSGNPITSVPVLADPGDVAGSPGIYYDKKDVNYTRTTSGRASLLVKPSDELRVDVGFNISRVEGSGGPYDNPTFKGGPWIADPRITFPASGDYQLNQLSLEPYRRDSQLTSADASYDMGFATLSSTSTYFTTKGQNGNDTNDQIFSLPASYVSYYTGAPINPRYAATEIYADNDHGFTQEIRLVSSPGKLFDYVLGVFYETEGRDVSWQVFEPGTTAQSIASGGVPVSTDGQGRTFYQTTAQRFEDRSIFGELTWHITKRWQATAGGRFFKQKFDESQVFNVYLFGIAGGSGSANSTSDHIGKLNTSYEFLDDHRLYATFSQGFRRGGANTFPTEGVLKESTEVQLYKPDTADNYEVGVKGKFSTGLRYTVDAFYIDWKNPQIGVSTPNEWPIVVNGAAARSRGFEAEVSTPLFVQNLNVSLSYAYVDATLTRSFCLPAGDGTGAGFISCGIRGVAGDRLPGTPKGSASATLAYNESLQDSRRIVYTLNGNYKSSIVNTLPNYNTIVTDLPSYVLFNGSVALANEHWSTGVYATNLLDHRAVFSAPQNAAPLIGTLANSYTISRPREIALRLSYQW